MIVTAHLLLSLTHNSTALLAGSHTCGTLSSHMVGVTWYLQSTLWIIVTRRCLKINTRVQFALELMNKYINIIA